MAGGGRRSAVSFDARGPVPEFAELNLAWPAPRWVDTSGKRAPVKIGQLDALSDEPRAYEGGVW